MKFKVNNQEIFASTGGRPFDKKKPLIIIGQSALSSKSGKYIFESIKSFLMKNDKINSDWNPINIISENASTVGSLDLGIYNTLDGSNETLDNLSLLGMVFIVVSGTLTIMNSQK